MKVSCRIIENIGKLGRLKGARKNFTNDEW